MATFVKAATVGEVPEGAMKHLVVAGKHIAISQIDGQFYAIDDTCTHEQCSLGDEGFLDGNVITCGCHGAQYDVTTGKVLALPGTYDLVSYTTKIDGADILIEI